MTKLSPEHTIYALTVFEKLFKRRELSQKWLEDHSGIAQPEISRILSRQKDPTKNELERLFQALGIPLSEIVSTLDALPENLSVYVATPLTGFTKDPKKDSALRQLVARLETLTGNEKFVRPGFSFYWPGNFTHPVTHANVPAKQVYITDRSLSSSYDLLVMLCVVPSFGIGQENEIATQAGIPAIRLIPEGTSRMITGSFLRTWDIPYTGTVETGIRFDESRFVEALTEARKLYFVHQALFRGLTLFNFGDRLRQLVDDRVSSRRQFAEQVGIDSNYLECMFTEPFLVCNPSAILLMRMAKVLNVSVAHLLWESEVDDAVFVASVASWKAWISATDGLDAKTALAIRDNWAEEYRFRRYAAADPSLSIQRVLLARDWHALYTKCHKKADTKQIKKEINKQVFREVHLSVAKPAQSNEITHTSRSVKKAAAK